MISLKFIFLLLLLTFSSVCLFANTDSRVWNLANGKTINAELVSVDTEKGIVILKKNEEEEQKYSINDFSLIDTAWLIEWSKVSNELADTMQDMLGEFNHYQHGGEYVSDFYVYTPSKYKKTKELPMLILFHPGGKGIRYLQRFMKAAEELGIIIVSSDSFRNSKDPEEVKKIMLTPINDEITDREPYNGYLVYQGGVPEVEEFVKNVHK